MKGRFRSGSQNFGFDMVLRGTVPEMDQKSIMCVHHIKSFASLLGQCRIVRYRLVCGSLVLIPIELEIVFERQHADGPKGYLRLTHVTLR